MSYNLLRKPIVIGKLFELFELIEGFLNSAMTGLYSENNILLFIAKKNKKSQPK